MSHKLYGQQVIVIGSGENPYVATSYNQMQSYLRSDYVGSFVKYKTDKYLNQSTQVPLTCKSKYPDSGAVDVGLGPAYVSAKIDEWLPEPGLVKIASIETFNRDTTLQGVSQPYSFRGYYDFYAWKYKDSNGAYTRMIIMADVTFNSLVYEPTSSTTWKDYVKYFAPLFLDTTLSEEGDISKEVATAFKNLPITMTISSTTYTLEAGIATGVGDIPSRLTFKQLYPRMGFLYYNKPNPKYNDYWGKYIGGDSDSDIGILGTAYLAWSTYKSQYWNNTSYPRCTYLYRDASVLFSGINTVPESQQTYKNDCIYVVNSEQKTRTTWQAESPLVQGDQLAGATYYFNQQITHKEYSDLCKQLIPSSQRVDDDSDAYFFYNVDNPQPKDSVEISNILSMLPLIDIDERNNFLISWLFFPSNVPHTPVNPINVGDTITSLDFATDIIPDFTKFDWSQAEIIEGTGKLLTLIEGTTPDYSNNDRLQVQMILAGAVLEGHTFAKDNYAITAGTGGQAVYITEEYAQLLGYTPGWLTSTISMDSTTVTSVSQQDIWGKYISKDGRWDNGDESSMFLFGSTGGPEEITDMTTITSASVVVPTSYTYADTIMAVPATLGKVNKPLITNGIIGKTANFTNVTENYDEYYFTQVLTLGNLFTESTEAGMDALLGDPSSNDGIMENRLYMYTGETTSKYTPGGLYILTENRLI